MPTPKAFNLIGAGDRAGLILTSDFPATGRTVAGFSDLFAGLGRAEAVWETAPPLPGRETGMTGRDHVGRWLADVTAAGLPVRAVLGFCVGAVYAAELAEELGAAQGAPVPLIVFDPERPDPELLRRHYDGVIGGLSQVLSPGELAASESAAGDALRESGDSMPKLADAFVRLLAEHGGPALRRSGLDQRRTGELLDTFSSFLAYLAAAADLDPRPAWGRAAAVSSGTAHSGLNPLPAEARAAAVATELGFPVQHTDLLRDPDVVRAVGSLLDGLGER